MGRKKVTEKIETLAEETVNTVEEETVEETVEEVKTVEPPKSEGAVITSEQLLELMNQLKAQQAEIEALKNAPATTAVYTVPANTVKSKKTIKLINLVRGTVVLKGTRIHTIEGQFNSIQVTEAEATIIVGQNNGAINSGCVYIDDKDFIAEHDLEDIYNVILSDKDLKTLFDKKPEEIIEMYNNTTDLQRKTIVTMIVKKCESGEKVDANVLYQIGRMCKRNLLEIQPEED